MESPLERMVRELVKTRSPDLYAELERDGELDHFIYYRVAAISSLVDEQRRREKWDFLPHLELIAKVNNARAYASEKVMSDLPLAKAA